MSSSPLVSVIVPTFNRPDRLRTTLQSILAQTLDDFEVIVINDGGIAVDDVVASIGDPRITSIAHDTNLGLPSARNSGLVRAQGKYVAYLDDDDIFYPQHLETLVASIQSADENIVYSDANQRQVYIRDGVEVIHAIKPAYGVEFSADLLLVSNYIPVLCVLHERSILRDTGLFNKNLTSHEDWEFWIRVSRKYAFKHVPNVTAEYLVHLDPDLQDRRRRLMFKTLVEVYQSTEGLLNGRPDLQQQRIEHIVRYMSDIEASSEIVKAMKVQNEPSNELMGVSLDDELRANPGFVERLPILIGYLHREKYALVEKIIRSEVTSDEVRTRLLSCLQQRADRQAS